MRDPRQDITEKRFVIGKTIVQEAVEHLRCCYEEDCEESGVAPLKGWKPTPEQLLQFIGSVNDVFYERRVFPLAMLPI